MSLRVYNVTRKIYLKPMQAKTAVDVCSAVWVQVGVSIRDVKDLKEVIALRNQRAADEKRSYVDAVGGYLEVEGCVYEPGLSNVESHRRERSYAMLTRRVTGAEKHAPFLELC